MLNQANEPVLKDPVELRKINRAIRETKIVLENKQIDRIALNKEIEVIKSQLDMLEAIRDNPNY